MSSERPIKILSLGLGQSNFLNQLYGSMKRQRENLSFNIDRFRDISEGVISQEASVFDNYYDFADHQPKGLDLYLSFLKVLTKRFFWKYLRYERKKGASLSELVSFIKKQSRYQDIVDHKLLPLNFDIYHFHFCTPYNLRYVPFLPKNVATICSFWGSDLYRNFDKDHIFYVSDALKYATAVTIQTPEMGENALSKYGGGFEKTLYYSKFTISEEIYQIMDAMIGNKTAIEQFKAQWNIPLNATVITIGYNANEAFSHKEIINELQKLAPSEKSKICCVLPLTYSIDGVYLDNLNTFIDAINDLQIVKIQHFLSHKDLALLRLATDIQVQLPSSDALSGSVTEVMYAGNTVIAGSWLPYAEFRRCGLHFLSIDTIDELIPAIKEIMTKPELIKEQNRENAKQVAAHFFPKQTTPNWVSLYEQCMLFKK